VRDATFEGGQKFPTLSVARQCPLVLLVEVPFGEGTALGNERFTSSEVEPGFYCIRSELILILTLQRLH
jgi:hypothetical protein